MTLDQIRNELRVAQDRARRERYFPESFDTATALIRADEARNTLRLAVSNAIRELSDLVEELRGTDNSESPDSKKEGEGQH